MSDIINLRVVTRLDIDAQRIIDGLENETFSQILVLGWVDDGNELYSASSTGKKGELLHLIEEFKHRLIAGEYD